MNSRGKLAESTVGSKTIQVKQTGADKTQVSDTRRHGYQHSVLFRKDTLNLKTILPASIDLIITSPPYNLSKNYSGNKADDSLAYQDYLNFSRTWLVNAYTWVRDTGRLCLNIGLDKNKNGKRPVYADLVQVALEIGWKYHTTIIWAENNISRRTAWGSWMSASAPHVIAPVEVIVVFYKHDWKRLNQGKSDITAEEFKNWTLGLWNFPGEKATKIGHVAPFPRELPKRCIKLFSFIGDTVLDPFLGSGTTMIEAMDNQRIAIGVEKELKYCNLINERLRDSLGNIKATKKTNSWRY